MQAVPQPLTESEEEEESEEEVEEPHIDRTPPYRQETDEYHKYGRTPSSFVKQPYLSYGGNSLDGPGTLVNHSAGLWDTTPELPGKYRMGKGNQVL